MFFFHICLNILGDFVILCLFCDFMTFFCTYMFELYCNRCCNNWDFKYKILILSTHNMFFSHTYGNYPLIQKLFFILLSTHNIFITHIIYFLTHTYSKKIKLLSTQNIFLPTHNIFYSHIWKLFFILLLTHNLNFTYT